MAISLGITLGSLVLAIVFTVIAERKARDDSGWRAAWVALLCYYGVCVGMVSALLVHFFELPEWAAIAIALPVAVPVLLFLGKASEH